MILVYTHLSSRKFFPMSDYTTYESNKFWVGEVNSNIVSTRWGRLGQRGQSKTYDKGGKYEAEDFLKKKIREKRRKGYREVSESEFNRLALIGATVGTANKVQSFCWMKRSGDGWEPVLEEIELNDPGVEPGMQVNFHRHNGESLTICIASDGNAYERGGRGWKLFEPTEKKLIDLVGTIREAMGLWVSV